MGIEDNQIAISTEEKPGRLNKRELAPTSRFLTERDQPLLQTKSELTIVDENEKRLEIPLGTTVIAEADFNVKIL